ncbi:MAG: hypothetical protein Q8941_16760 [Bacteroidota bacterium]|nr:hypothetical protein [Bacteroidota bacterium]
MKQVFYMVLCVCFFNIASGQKLTTPPPKKIPADLSIVSITFENATITKQPSIIPGPNGTQPANKPVTSPNPAVKCTVVIRNDYSDSYYVVLAVSFPPDATILSRPVSSSIPERQGSFPQVTMNFGHMTAGQTASAEFVFTPSKYKNAVMANIISSPMDEVTGNNSKSALFKN